MQVAPKIIFVFRDAEGFGPAIVDALQPNPKSPLQRLETSFELSLESYGINDRKASGELVHFIDSQGSYQVSVLLLPIYEPPIVVCAVREVLAAIQAVNPSSMPTLILPSFVVASKLEANPTTGNHKVTLYGTQIGPTTDITRAMVAGIQKPPPSLQIHSEPLACLLQLVRIIKLPTVLLIGPRAQHQPKITADKELDVLYEMGEFLACVSGMCFSREQIHWNPTDHSKSNQEPWRALYG